MVVWFFCNDDGDNGDSLKVTWAGPYLLESMLIITGA